MIKGGKWGAIDKSGKEVVSPVKNNSEEVEGILKKKFQWTLHRKD